MKNLKEDGELTEDEIGSSLSNLGSTTGLDHAYLSLSLPERNLRKVSVLCTYVHLQKLQVPFNKIKDLSCVSHMPHLITLDASHNEISDFFGFQPPSSLKEVNLSHNQMSEMKDLPAYSSLRTLNLDHNRFKEIRGLQKCVSLTYLSLAHNKLSCIKGIEGLPLKEISLRGNQIQKIENMKKLPALQALDLGYNKIQSLSGLQNIRLLGKLNLEGNLVTEIKEAFHLQDLRLLRAMSLQQNPVQDQPDYRLAVVFLLQQLTSLDQQEVTVNEKVSALNKHDPPAEVIAAKDHMMHVVYQMMQPQVLFHSTLPSLDTPYPMLVLTGPRACGKRELAHRLCREFCDFFAYGACHTTRSPYFGEMDGCDYHFVSEEEFHNMIRMGKFIETMRYGEHMYGLSLDAIESVANEGLACCVHMELEGVQSLKKTHLEPRYLLLLPTDREDYARRLRQRGLYSYAQIHAAVLRIDDYIAMNRERPGYFDCVISCDDVQQAYGTLRQVVRDYLGIDEQAASGGTGERGEPSTGATGDKCKDPAEARVSNKVEDKLATPKSPAEVASTQRRQQLAREALLGRSPGVYTQLFNRCTFTAPAAVGTQAGSAYPQEHNEDSSQESRSSSALSAPPSPRDSPTSLQGRPELIVDSLDVPGLGPELDQLRDLAGSSNTPDAPHATSRGTSPGPATSSSSRSSRPGADTKPILPPIPSGRRTTESPTAEP